MDFVVGVYFLTVAPTFLYCSIVITSPSRKSQYLFDCEEAFISELSSPEEDRMELCVGLSA